MIRILLVDDHPVVRLGFRAMLESEPDLTVVGEASDGADARALTRDLDPDVVLMDLRMPGVDGVTATTTLLADDPDRRVIVVTTFDTDHDILRAVEAGAIGYLLKDAPRDELLAAVRNAARGETVLAPAVAARLMKRMRAPTPDTLSSREVEVLAAAARGLTNAAIGSDLFIGEATVKTHLQRAFTKLGVDTRTAAVTEAIRLGILPSP